MGSSLGRELESDDDDNTTKKGEKDPNDKKNKKNKKKKKPSPKDPPKQNQYQQQPKPQPVQQQPISNPQAISSDSDDDGKINQNVNYKKKGKYKIINNDSSKNVSSIANSFAQPNDMNIINNLNYIVPSSDEIKQQKELYLSHICHRGHYKNSSEFSAQNLLQNDLNSGYLSLKTYNFDANKNNKTNHDWFIFRINSFHLIKITEIVIKYSMTRNNNNINKYPSAICLQFMSSASLKKVIKNSLNHAEWTQTHFISPYILNTNKPDININGEHHVDRFKISFDASYIDELCNNQLQLPQYVRISFLSSFGLSNNSSKYSLNNLKLFGVPLLSNNNELILINNVSSYLHNNKQYKYEIENKFDSKLQPQPSKIDGRILMREHIFFINIGNKTINMIKSAICDEYNRLSVNNSDIRTYNAKNIILVVDGYGFVNDMMDTSVLSKTLIQIGAKTGKNNTGYYITVGFC